MSGIRDQGCSNCKYGGTHLIELFLSTKFTIEGVLLYIFFKEPKRLLLHTPSFFNFFSSSSLRRWTAARISHPLRFSGDGRECFSTTSSRFPIPKFGKEQKMSSEGRMRSCLMTSTDEIHNSGEKSLANCLKTTSANKRLYSRSTAKHYLGAVESAPDLRRPRQRRHS